MADNGHGWPVEHCDELRRIAPYCSAGVAAAKLNEKFGTSYSRNAVIGRRIRMGLGNASEAGKERLERKPQQKAAPIVRAVAPSQPRPKPVCVDAEPLHLPLIELEHHQCRWPFGDGPFTFCGHPRYTDRSTSDEQQTMYCLKHLQMSIGHGTQQERSATRSFPRG